MSRFKLFLTWFMLFFVSVAFTIFVFGNSSAASEKPNKDPSIEKIYKIPKISFDCNLNLAKELKINTGYNKLILKPESRVKLVYKKLSHKQYARAPTGYFINRFTQV